MLQSVDVRANSNRNLLLAARAVDGRSAYARVAASPISLPRSSSPLTSLAASTSARGSSPGAEQTVELYPGAERSPKRRRASSEDVSDPSSGDSIEESAAIAASISRRREQDSYRRPDRVAHRADGASELFRLASPASPGQRRYMTTIREDSILSQDVHGIVESDLSDDVDAGAGASPSPASSPRFSERGDDDDARRASPGSPRHSALLSSPRLRQGSCPDSPQPEPARVASGSPKPVRNDTLDAHTAHAADADGSSSSQASSALLRHPFAPWTGTQDPPLRAASRHTHDEDATMHLVEDDETRAVSAGSGPSPAVANRPSRQGQQRADPAEPSPIRTAEAAVTAIHTLGETLLDSAQLVTAAVAPQEPLRRQVQTTWNIKPDLFDFGLWCRANGVAV